MLARLEGAPGIPRDFARAVLANVVSEEENVRAVAAKVQLGEADAGVVYASDVTGPPRLRLIPIPDDRNVIAAYPIAPLPGPASAGVAEAFVGLLLGPEGQQVLQRHGFLAVTAPAGSPAPAWR
jgi:molybdate transport system substrate-binding protein